MISRWFTLVAIAAVLAACQQNPSQSYTSSEGKFSINMPATPNEEVKNVDSKAGKMAIHQFVATHDEAAYIIIYIDYPATLAKPGMEDAVLDAARDGGVANSHGKLLNERHIKLQGKYPGREITILTKNGNIVVKDRIYLVNNRMYQVLVSAAKDKIGRPETEAYLDSFHLNEN